MPAYGFFIRHAKGVELNNVEVNYLKEDQRPAFVLNDVQDATFVNAKAQHVPNVPVFVLKNVTNFSALLCPGLPDTRLPRVDNGKL